MNKLNIFEKELKYFNTENGKKSAMVAIENLPDYFFEVAASSTGKYHPSYSLGEGGLVRHTKAAMKLANELLNNNSSITSFSEVEVDLILFSLLVHDGIKHGFIKDKYVKFEHPLLVNEFLDELKDKLYFSENELKIIKGAIASHMGEWNTNNYSNVVLPVPKNKVEKFVHMCDFLASRKFIEVDLGGSNE